MKISYRLMSKLTGLKLPEINNLIERINSQLGGVEDIVKLYDKFNDACIVKVINCEKHPNADRLSVCKIDDGNKNQNVDRDENGFITVVCGAPNVRKDMFAVWLPPESIVPSSFNDEKPFKLDSRKLRGVMSYGMLAAGDELDINSDHGGIVEINQEDINGDLRLETGAKFNELFDLDDIIIDIENKMFTHRPDLFGQIGVAREVFAILNNENKNSVSFEEFDWYKNKPKFNSSSSANLAIENQAKYKVYNFVGMAFENVKVQKSPLWLQVILCKLGIKPVNNIVDITNYAMVMTGQPTHAYDLDKVENETLIARNANVGETVKLLDGKKYSLSGDDIVIADSRKVLGLGGIMGGFDSQVTEKTNRVVVEVATFDMYSIRRSSMKHGLFTDAVTRFNKGQSPYQNDRILKYIFDLIVNITGSKQASGIISAEGDINNTKRVITIEADFINKRLGTSLEIKEIARILRLVNFDINYVNEFSIEIKIPFWRMDIEIKEDIVEEVGRIYGFDRIKKSLPSRTIKPVKSNDYRKAKKILSEKMLELGANELLTYTFVNKKIIENSEQNVDNCFELSNALSPDLQCYRLSILPSILDKVHSNIKAGQDKFVIYEIGKGHNINLFNEEKLPKEYRLLDGVLASKNSENKTAFYELKSFISNLFNDLNIPIKTKKYNDIDNITTQDTHAMFDEKRSVLIVDSRGGILGVLGEFKKSVSKNFKLPEYCAGFSINFDKMSNLIKYSKVDYSPLSKFPAVTNDLSIKVGYETEYERVYDLLDKKSKEYSKEVLNIKPISIFSPDDKKYKTFTFRIEISSKNRTLKTKEANKIVSELEEFVLSSL